MEERIQQALDEQWDTLEARSPKIRKVRRHLALLFGEFAAQKQEESQALEKSINDTHTRANDIEKANKQRDELQKQLETESANPLAQELASLTAEVHDLDKQIAELTKKRAAAERRRREVDSVVSSRTAKFRDAIADVNRKSPPEEAAKLHSLQSQLARLDQQKRGVDAEMNAAKSGQDMWQQVCQELDTLDHEIRGLKRDQMDRISFLLKRKVTLLESLSKTAHEAGWTALVVAISHELQILNEALEALGKAERES